MQDEVTHGAENATDASVGQASEPDPIQTARDYGIDISLINALLDLPVIERIRRNDAGVLLDRAIRAAFRPHRS
jgi:hypothetical protein